MYSEPFSSKQFEFIQNAKAKHNLAHGSVRAGKTVGVMFAFLCEVLECPGDQIWIIGRTFTDVYHNCIRLIWDRDSFASFAAVCTWMKGDRVLLLGGKKIYCLGAGDEGSIGAIQGKTFDLCYCNEMTLYPKNVIQMISTRLSMPHSKLFADMNPVQPDHLCKRWIDLAISGDKNYYQLHWTMDDNPYLEESFKAMQRQTLSGVFFRRNYLGEWCLAEGAIFDFFDRDIHVTQKAQGTTLYWIAGIDYGAFNPFACVLIRVSDLPEGQQLWVEKELYYDPSKQRQKAPSEYVRDLVAFFGDYTMRAVYLDPSAAGFRAELSKCGIHTVETNNEVFDGILSMTNALKEGTLSIGTSCPNLIREMEGYVWDPKKGALGEDAPLKQNDHAVDALRYAIKSYMGKRLSLKKKNSDDGEGASLVGKKSLNTQSLGHGWQRF